jgi:hypothetical protein
VDDRRFAAGERRGEVRGNRHARLRRRLAGAFALALLAAAGAALGALTGDGLVLVSSDGSTTATVCSDTPGTTTVSLDELQAQVSAATACSDTATPTETTAPVPPTTTQAQPPQTPPSPTPPPDDSSGQPNTGPSNPTTSHVGGAKTTKAPPHEQAESEAPMPMTHGVLWLHRNVGDPTPPAKRLSRNFADNVRSVARRHRLHWWRILGYVRASGHRGRSPAQARQLDRIAVELVRAGARKHPWAAYQATSKKDTAAKRIAFARRALALAQYDRAVGLRGLVIGLEKDKPLLAKRLLADDHIEIYAGGRSDVEAGRVNVRILVLLRYLRFAYGTVSVSCLVSGHSLFARPGVVSAHIFGLAVDISALGDVPILGHQQRRGVTERAIEKLLLLPAELRPVQIISLLGLGGPSFPLANHYDHIHVGY